MLLRPTSPVLTWGWLPLMAGVAMVQTVGGDARLKWPNDLLLGRDGLKVGGILTQTDGGACVVGVGVNVTTTREELPVPEATSLVLCGFTALEREGILTAFLPRFGRLYQDWLTADGDAAASGLAADYRQFCSTIGREVTVRQPSGDLAGLALDVDQDGRLLVQEPSGRQTAVAAGDVTHVRPG